MFMGFFLDKHSVSNKELYSLVMIVKYFSVFSLKMLPNKADTLG